MPKFRSLRFRYHGCQLLPNRFEVSDKGTIRAIERIPKTIVTKGRACLYVFSVIGTQLGLYISDRSRDRD